MRRIEELSSVTLEEWVSLVATLHAVENDKFSCSTCLSSNAGRPDAAQHTERLRASKACVTPFDRPVHAISLPDGRELRFWRCIGNSVRPALTTWLQASEAYEAGILPYPGGLFDQPAKAMEILSVVGNWKARRRKEAAEQQQKKANAVARRGGGRRG